MIKYTREIRDPIHVFIRLDTDESKVLDSRPFQRLRQIHQLALSYLVYPGATHKRFEHCLGTMELASRVYDVVTHPDAIHPDIRPLLPELTQPLKRDYWRRVLRMAALCHDIGHLPFSHAAEKELLPDGWNHERLSVDIINGDEMRAIWNGMIPPLLPEHIAKVAVGPKILTNMEFTAWETILSEIIVGNAFGVDRIDYLLRDSLHAGVEYGKFDHYRLIDTLRILPLTESGEPDLGIEEGGIHSAEALLLARYFMYSQVYMHPIRSIYDKHLVDFLTTWLPNGSFPTAIDEFLDITDVEVLNSLSKAAKNTKAPGHDPARRIARRQHFKLVYERNMSDIRLCPNPGSVIYSSLCEKYGSENVHHHLYDERGGVFYFPVIDRDERIVSSSEKSVTLANIPLVNTDYVFMNPSLAENARAWLRTERERILIDAASQEEEA